MYQKFILINGNKIMQKELQEIINKTQELVSLHMEKLVPSDNENLTKAIRYSLFCKGKRLRPLLVLETAKIFNTQNKDDLLTIACAVEMIHIFSLIHDDLPCMDNDDYRRNELTCHKKFNEYDALLAGDSLIPLSFETIISKTNLSYEDKCKIILILSKAIGYKGMCLGQSLDMEFEKSNKSKTSLEAEKINIYKTGYLFKACIEIGCILGKANEEDTKTLIDFAINFGKAFQLADDIDDLEISNNEIEKTKIKINQLVNESLKNLDNIKYKNKNIDSVNILKLIAKFCIS